MGRPEPTLVTLLRHGEVAGRPHVFRGADDAPLSERGRAQVLAAAAGLGHLAGVATSPRLRCRAVAEEIAAARGLELAVLADLAELDFGAWEGRSVAEVAEAWPEAHAAFCRFDDAAAAPGGERLGDFRRRVLAAWSAWLADAGGGHRLLVCHAGVMRVLLQAILDLPDHALYRIALPEAAHFQVSILAGHAPVLLSLN